MPSRKLGAVPKKTEVVDADIRVSKLFSNTTLRQLHLLEPFGQGNPQPIFRDTEARLCEIMAIGQDKRHLRLSFNNDKTTIKGIAFGLGSLAEKCRTSNNHEIYYTPSVNFFRGKRTWQARVTKIDLKGK